MNIEVKLSIFIICLGKYWRSGSRVGRGLRHYKQKWKICLPTVYIKGTWFQNDLSSISWFKMRFMIFYLYTELVKTWAWQEPVFPDGVGRYNFLCGFNDPKGKIQKVFYTVTYLYYRIKCSKVAISVLYSPWDLTACSSVHQQFI